MSRRSLRRATVPGIRPGTFVKTYLRAGRGHVTIVVEGSDQDGHSVSGIALDATGLAQLIERLTNLQRSGEI